MRHIHPVRQSGPIPAYDGPFTMEDVKLLNYQSHSAIKAPMAV